MEDSLETPPLVNMQSVKRLAKAILFWPLHLIGFIFPRRSDLWVFGSAKNAFSENSKYLYLWCSNNIEDVRCVWISGNSSLVAQLREHGLSAEYRWSLRGLWISIRARVYIFSFYASDINFLTSGGAYHVNLWHGVGPKAIEFSIKSGPLAQNTFGDILQRLVTPERFRRPHFLLSTSPTMADIFASAFRVERNAIFVGGYPRAQVAYDSDLRLKASEITPARAELLRFFARYPRYILYMPTWRDVAGDFWGTAIPDISEMNDALEKANVGLVIKPHPNSPAPASFSSERIFIASPTDDAQALIYQACALITDYSSVVYDYLAIRDTGVAVYAFDLERYTRESRDLVFDFAKVIPSDPIVTYRGLVSYISTGAILTDKIAPDRLSSLRAIFMDGSRDSSACQDLFDGIRRSVESS